MNIKSYGQKIIDQITGIFSPVINIITATSIIKGLLILLTTTGLLTTTNGIYQMFYAASDGLFYFLPFFLAFTAAKQWKVDTFTALLIPVAMLYPDIVSVLENKTAEMTFLGLTVPPTIYHSSVLPVLFAVGLLVFVEKLWEKALPNSIKGFAKPILCILIVLPITFLVFGPLGTLIGDFLTKIFFALYTFSPVVAGLFMGFFIQPMVVVGAHWSIVPVCINNIANNGYDIILPLLGAAVYGQSGAALCVGLFTPKTEENKEKRRIAFQAALAAALGVTEPALFGVNVARPRAMITACISGAIGGAIVGIAGTHCYSFAFPSFITSVAYVGPGFGIFLLSMVLGFVISVALMFAQKKYFKES